MSNVIMLSVIMMYVTILNVIMLNVKMQTFIRLIVKFSFCYIEWYGAECQYTEYPYDELQ